MANVTSPPVERTFNIELDADEASSLKQLLDYYHRIYPLYYGYERGPGYLRLTDIRNQLGGLL